MKFCLVVGNEIYARVEVANPDVAKSIFNDSSCTIGSETAIVFYYLSEK